MATLNSTRVELRSLLCFARAVLKTLCRVVVSFLESLRVQHYPCNDMGKQPSTSTALLAFFVLVVVVAAQSPKGTEGFSFSFLGASPNDSCANADCQQGTCVPNGNALVSILFPYTCKCNSGWSTLQNVIPLLEIPSLPCNVPNCSLNLQCAGKSSAPAPAPSAPIPSANTTACLVPGICGHGRCEITSMKDSLVPTFKCVCDPGYANVLNMTAGFCVNHCEINGGCQNLNLTLPGLSSPPPPSPPSTPADQTANAGRTISPEPSPQSGASPSTSAGCRGKPLSTGFCMAGALVMGLTYS